MKNITIDIVSQLKHQPASIETNRDFREMCFGVFAGLDSDTCGAQISKQFGYCNQNDMMTHC